MNDLKGKIGLVTGASRGIGNAIASALARAGADVAVNFRIDERGARTVTEQIRREGARSIMIQADVSSQTEVTRMVAFVEKELGPISILVNNAGIATARTIDTISEQDWDQTLSVNLKSAFLVIQAVLPGMRERQWGRIINISSVAAQIGGIVGVHYAASKAGILGITHYYAAQLAKEGITVNTLSPGLTSTDMARSLPQIRPDIIPVGRLGTAEEIADAAIMIIQNAYMTGQTVQVNGGRYMS
ncbi:MAG TPA: 3-oxoacyl-ACP reductase family protein [Nitrospirota bacterium]|nr:3-oxoacyl-ACP reductase family protein [Nitrospirota bacterium]